MQEHARSRLRAGIGAVKDHKANTSLTVLLLDRNKVGDAGAAALADALQAMVLTCKKMCVQGVCLLSKQMSLYKVVSRVGVFKLLCSVRSSFFVILLVAWRKTFTQVCGVGGVRGLFST